MDDYKNYGKPVIKNPALRAKIKAALTWFLVLAVFVLVGTVEYDSLVATKKSERREQAEVVLNKGLSSHEALLAEFFSAHGSPAAVEMSRAVAGKKRPRLLAAVAVVESNGTPWAKGKAGEVTAWQIKELEWGSAGVTIEEHAQKAEDILEELLRQHSGNMRRALSAYNGDKSGKYAAKVMRKVAQL